MDVPKKIKNGLWKAGCRNYRQAHYRPVLLAMIALIAVAFCCAGCTGEREAKNGNAFHLNLNTPEVEGKDVTVNGGVEALVDRIQWNWGDGQVDKHRFFPAGHTYKEAGLYTIKVTVFDRRDRKAAKSVTVEVR